MQAVVLLKVGCFFAETVHMALIEELITQTSVLQSTVACICTTSKVLLLKSFSITCSA